MPASRVQLEVPHALRDLYCPACAAPVFTEADGPTEHTCDHVRFFIDREGELSLPDPESLAGEDQRRQQALVDLVEATESWDEFLTRAAKVLPASVLILEIVETGGDDEGTQSVVAFELAPPR